MTSAPTTAPGNARLQASVATSMGLALITAPAALSNGRSVVLWQKKLIEDYLEASCLPFVSLRPGAFIGGQDFWPKTLRKGRLIVLGSSSVPWSYVHIGDVARYLAQAVEGAEAVGQRIDIGTDRPVSQQEIAELFAAILGREIRLRTPPWRLIHGGMALGGLFNPFLRDSGAMLDYLLTGRYVADTTAQREVFGDVPTVEDSLHRYAAESGLIELAPEASPPAR